jgi:hypothetical protein
MLQAKITKIMSKDVQNVEKIAEMATIFEKELMPMYKKRIEDLVHGSSQLSLEHGIEEEEKAKASRADVILGKY